MLPGYSWNADLTERCAVNVGTVAVALRPRPQPGRGQARCRLTAAGGTEAS